jgi:16S rRNA (adenine1518-N6/adenine1519-N6)-dimethyltransferase
MNLPIGAHRARKRFGQHFLHDQQIIGQIVDCIDPVPGQPLVEIGPGLGALTLPVLAECRRLHVVELDRDVIPRLEAACVGRGELVVHRGDALAFDFGALARELGAPLRLIGNLPYNISTPLLFHFLEVAGAVRDMHFMLQKEVVDRMAAAPGGKDYGRLTVMLAARVRVEKLFDVGPGAFRPPPKVDSSIVRLIPHATAPFAVPDAPRFAEVVMRAFSQRRKTLRNSLQGVVAPEAFSATGIDPQRRAETLAPAEFAALAAFGASSSTEPP